MSAEAGRLAGEAWAFRARVERDAAQRFSRLASEIAAFDPGSPVPGLLAGAARDEERHAALCAELCAAYGHPAGGAAEEERIAPAALTPRDAALYEMVAACCITETESVATLTTLLAEEAEPRVREVLHEIARDEVSHGRMGWAHLAREASARDVSMVSSWIPMMLSGTVGGALFRELAEEPDDLLRHGVLPHALKRQVFVRTLEDVVFPGLEEFGIDARPAREWLAARLAQRAAS